MAPDANVEIYLDGQVDDLYALGILFPEGAVPDLHIVTSIVGEKDGCLDRVIDAGSRETFLTGAACLPLLDETAVGAEKWVAAEILAPLNGYATLADSNFRPVRAISATGQVNGMRKFMSFSYGNEVNEPTRLISVDRHANLRDMRNNRVEFMRRNPLGAYAANVLARPPSWAEYYRLLEDIAGSCGTTLDKLSERGLADRQPLNAFKKAANNRTFGRHGASKRDETIPQDEMMNLLEAREFVRRLVSQWFDEECGGRMGRDRVDGGRLRFGLDD